jgi:pyruvate,water dikinase
MGRFSTLFSKGDQCQLLINLEGKHVLRYQHFKSLLEHNHLSLSLMAELEQQYYGGRPFLFPRVKERIALLLKEVKGLLESFLKLSEGKFSSLSARFEKIEEELKQLAATTDFSSEDLVVSLDKITAAMKRVVGAKVGNLALIRRDLGLPVPDGFAVTARAYEKFMEEKELNQAIEKEWSRFSPEALEEIDQISRTIRALILGAEIPGEIQKAILEAYENLKQNSPDPVRISMRSSAIGEDTEASFAGQFETVLNVTDLNLLQAYKTVLASKYSARAILYRYRQGFDDAQTPMCVAGIRMIEARASGVLYTRDPFNAANDHIRISALWGLGEHLVDGSASPDRFLIHRETGKIVEKIVSRKETRLVTLPQGGTALEEVPGEDRESPALNDDQVRQLVDYGLKLEDYFGQPQDIEWALDQQGQMIILQSRPLGLQDPVKEQKEQPSGSADLPILLSAGQTASPGNAVGPVFILTEAGLETVPDEAILVVKTASPDYAKLMGRVKGIITDIGSITSHLASVAREFRVPALFDTQKATAVLRHGEIITLAADRATVYRGIMEEGLGKEQRPPNLF